MKKWFFLLIFVLTLNASVGCLRENSHNPYNLDLIDSEKAYSKSVEEDQNNLMVDLESYIPRLVLDIRYATDSNFTGETIYTKPKAFVRKPVAEALLEIQNKLNNIGYGLKIFDAYRPYAATLKFYEVYPDTNFVAAPWKGSVHNRGCAVDVSLIDIVTQQELPMPTKFDDFSEKASLNYEELDPIIKANRDMLVKFMTENGFTSYEYEWWHFNFKDREKFKIMNISFEELEKHGFN